MKIVAVAPLERVVQFDLQSQRHPCLMTDNMTAAVSVEAAVSIERI